MQISTYIIKAKQHIHQDMPQNTCSGVYKCISIKMLSPILERCYTYEWVNSWLQTHRFKFLN
jgi:hypothetical protein